MRERVYVCVCKLKVTCPCLCVKKTSCAHALYKRRGVLCTVDDWSVCGHLRPTKLSAAFIYFLSLSLCFQTSQRVCPQPGADMCMRSSYDSSATTVAWRQREYSWCTYTPVQMYRTGSSLSLGRFVTYLEITPFDGVAKERERWREKEIEGERGKPTSMLTVLSRCCFLLVLHYLLEYVFFFPSRALCCCYCRRLLLLRCCCLDFISFFFLCDYFCLWLKDAAFWGIIFRAFKKIATSPRGKLALERTRTSVPVPFIFSFLSLFLHLGEG